MPKVIHCLNMHKVKVQTNAKGNEDTVDEKVFFIFCGKIWLFHRRTPLLSFQNFFIAQPKSRCKILFYICPHSITACLWLQYTVIYQAKEGNFSIKIKNKPEKEFLPKKEICWRNPGYLWELVV